MFWPWSRKKEWCDNILMLTNFMVTMCRLLKQDMFMEVLQPSFTLIGSIVEGSRIGQADELDIMLFFKGLTEKERGSVYLKNWGQLTIWISLKKASSFSKKKNGLADQGRKAA